MQKIFHDREDSTQMHCQRYILCFAQLYVFQYTRKKKKKNHLLELSECINPLATNNPKLRETALDICLTDVAFVAGNIKLVYHANCSLKIFQMGSEKKSSVPRFSKGRNESVCAARKHK